MSFDSDPTRLVDEWLMPDLSPTDRTKIKAHLHKAHAAFLRADFRDPYSFITPMQQAFNGIAGVLFDARLLTVDVLSNQLRLFVIESAIAGNWLYFAKRDETRGELFPGYFGNVAVWRLFNERLLVVFKAEIADWTSKLLEREAAHAGASVSREEHALDESSPTESEGIPKLELIEPLLATFVAQTIEPIPSWIKANEGPHTGLVADFGNPPGVIGRRSIPARGVIARVVYRDGDDERLTVNSCSWLEQSNQRIDFQPGEMHKLVVAVVTGGDQKVFALENRRERIPVDGGYDPGIRAMSLGKLPIKAELALIDEEGRTMFRAELLLERDADKVISARKIEPVRTDGDAAIDHTGIAQVDPEISAQSRAAEASRERGPDKKKHKARVDFEDSLISELASVRDRLGDSASTLEGLRERFPNYKLWTLLAGAEQAELLEREFKPKVYARTLTARKFGVGKEAIKKSRQILKRDARKD